MVASVRADLHPGRQEDGRHGRDLHQSDCIIGMESAICRAGSREDGNEQGEMIRLENGRRATTRRRGSEAALARGGGSSDAGD